MNPVTLTLHRFQLQNLESQHLATLGCEWERRHKEKETQIQKVEYAILKRFKLNVLFNLLPYQTSMYNVSHYFILQERAELQKYLHLAKEQKAKDDSIAKARKKALDEKEEKLQSIVAEKDRKELKAS